MGHEGHRWRAAKLAAAARALKSASGIESAPFSLAFLTDRRRIVRPEPILRAMPKGSAVIYRDYDDPRRRAAARRFAAICRRRGVLLLIGDDVSLAEEIGADGVHLPARALEARSSARKIGLMTASCHNLAEMRLAAEAGADLALLGPAFKTDSHPGSEYLGASRFRMLAASAPLPLLALGGVDETNASFLRAKNVVGLAAIGAFAASL